MDTRSRLDPEAARRVVARWVDEIVVGWSLCPFARRPRDRGLVRIRVLESPDAADQVEGALEEAVALLDTPAQDLSNTLVVLLRGAEDFERFLDLADALRDALDRAGAASLLQVATFHPDYRFAGVPVDDPGHWTNRSPLPVLHLLRQSEVTEAVDGHSDPGEIPDRNLSRMRELGEERLQRRWSELFGDDGRPGTHRD